MKTAIYPGTFDPVTLGHIDIIQRATTLFDRVIVSVAESSHKQPLFTAEERMAMITDAVTGLERVSVTSFEGLLMEYAEKEDAVAVIRGLRAVSDFEYEFQMALINRRLSSRVETVFLMPNEQYTYLNSSIVRELARYGGDVSQFVPPNVAGILRKKHT